MKSARVRGRPSAGLLRTLTFRADPATLKALEGLKSALPIGTANKHSVAIRSAIREAWLRAGPKE